MASSEVEDLLRRWAPQVLGALVRRYGNFDVAEDAVQEALLAAVVQWPRDGVPHNPPGWLLSVAARRMTDLLRSDRARRDRERTVGLWAPTGLPPGRPGEQHPADIDDTLTLLFLCCHPALTEPSQIALTLRAVGGLTTSEIARALLVSEATVTRRITRAKQSIRDSCIPFALPEHTDAGVRLEAVLRVLYLVFTEGYVSTAGPGLQRPELAVEAIRLTRLVRVALPADRETVGLLALMLLIHARHRARTGPDGTLIPMASQNRSLWDDVLIAEGTALLPCALAGGPAGVFGLQAAIAALHDEAPTAADTDWPQIVALYEALLRLDPNPVVALNHAVAVAMACGPAAGLRLLDRLGRDPQMVLDRRLHAVQGHLLERAGDIDGARTAYLHAARRATNVEQQRYLNTQAARLSSDGRPDSGDNQQCPS